MRIVSFTRALSISVVLVLLVFPAGSAAQQDQDDPFAELRSPDLEEPADAPDDAVELEDPLAVPVPDAAPVPDTAPGEMPWEVLPPTTVVGEIAPGETPVTTPTQTLAPAGQVGSATTVITGEQIRASGHSTVSDVLRGSTGVDVVQQGPPGGLTSVFLRGAESRHTKVLLDGIPVNDPSSASRLFDFSTLSVDSIERIEIVRGPQSTLHGTDAIGGVINVITQRGEGPATATGRVMGGSYGTVRGSANVSGGTSQYHYALGGSMLYVDGFSAVAGGTDDMHRLGTATGRLGWNLTEDLEVEYIFRWSDGQTGIDSIDFFGTGLPIDDPSRYYLVQSYFSRLQTRWDTLDGIFQHRLAFDFTDYQREDTGGDFGFPTGFAGQTRKIEYQTDVRVTCDNTLTFGVDYLDESGIDTYGNDGSQNKYGIYLQDQFQLFERFTGIVGFRWDDWNQAGPAQTYQFRTVYDIEETGTSLHGTLGTGFYAPSLSELAFGVPDLQPERSKGWDAGATQRLLDDRLVLEGYYFRNDFRNLLVFDFGIPPFGALDNIGKARTHGVELMGTWYLTPDTTFNSSYTRTDSLNVDTGNVLPRRPRNKTMTGVAHRFLDGRANANLYALFHSSSQDTDGSRLAGYTLLNLAGHYQMTDRLRWFCRFDNLLDQEYEVIRGYNTPRFSAFGGFEITH